MLNRWFLNSMLIRRLPFHGWSNRFCEQKNISKFNSLTLSVWCQTIFFLASIEFDWVHNLHERCFASLHNIHHFFFVSYFNWITFDAVWLVVCSNNKKEITNWLHVNDTNANNNEKNESPQITRCASCVLWIDLRFSFVFAAFSLHFLTSFLVFPPFECRNICMYRVMSYKRSIDGQLISWQLISVIFFLSIFFFIRFYKTRVFRGLKRKPHDHLSKWIFYEEIVDLWRTKTTAKVPRNK